MFSLPLPVQADLRVVRLHDRAVIPFAQMIEEIGKNAVIVLGEGHDSQWHHELQLEMIRHLKSNDHEIVVGLEMFRAESQPVLDRWTKDELKTDEFIQEYYKNWNLPWPLYQDIFYYIRERNIPALGLNVPLHITRKVARKGFQSLSPEELKQLPPGVSCDIDPSYKEYIKRIFKSHVPEGKQNFEFFCEAQVLWDQAMAWYLNNYLQERQEVTAVVLAGLIHAMKPGIPRQMALQGSRKIVVVLPEIDEISPFLIGTNEADYIILR